MARGRKTGGQRAGCETSPNDAQLHARATEKPTVLTIAQSNARARNERQLRTLQAQAAFIEEYSARGVVLLAARSAGVSRRTVYDWLQDDPEFAKRFQQVKEDVTDLLEAEARRRAELGWLEPVYQMGQCLGYIRKYDTALMCLLLKGNRPDVYKERQEIDQRLTAQVIDPRTSTDDELEARILAAAEDIRVRQAKRLKPPV